MKAACCIEYRLGAQTVVYCCRINQSIKEHTIEMHYDISQLETLVLTPSGVDTANSPTESCLAQVTHCSTTSVQFIVCSTFLTVKYRAAPCVRL